MLLKRLQILLLEFATLIVFWAVYWPFELKPAIAAVVVYVVVDALRRHWQRLPFTPLYLISTVLTICFGAIDLVSQAPFMIKYEAVISNVAVGVMFVAGAMGERPLIQNVAEDWAMQKFPKRADIRRFFMLFTLFWAAYFFIKAGVYLWLGETMSMERALAVRAMIGIPSLLFMIAISALGRRLYVLSSYLGLLPAPGSETRETASAPSTPGL